MDFSDSNKEIKLCDYGCGQPGIYQQRNGKWCCNIMFQQCPQRNRKISKTLNGHKVSIETRKKLKLINLGKKQTEETKQKIGKSNTGKYHNEETKQKLRLCNIGRKLSKEACEKNSRSNKGRKSWNKGKTGVYSEEVIKRMSEAKKGNIPWNKGRTGVYSEEVLKNIKINNKLTIEKIHKKYPTFSKEEEMRYNPDKPEEKEIQVHCKNHNCPNSKEQGGWFTPTGHQFDGRRRALEDPNGTEAHYFYCSEQCKQECPLYHKSIVELIKEEKIRLGIIKEPFYTSEEYNIWRQEVLKRANNECQYCGKPATDCHHIQPQKLDPIYVLDPDNGIACCEECHYKYGHKDKCNSGYLAYKICK